MPIRSLDADLDVEVWAPDRALFAHGVLVVKRSQVGAYFGHTKPLADKDPFIVPGFDQRYGHGLAPYDDVEQGGQISFCETGAICHHAEHGWNAHKKGGLLFLQGPEKVFGIKFFQEANIASMVQEGSGQDIPAPCVERRHTVDRAALRIDH